MFLLTGYEYFLGFLLIAAAVPVLALVTNLIVAPKGRTGERKLTYESGMEPIGGAWIQFNIRYYMFALVFVIFDVETVFLYPWAVAFNRLGLLAFIEALIFIAILVIALAYAWRKGALEWSYKIDSTIITKSNKRNSRRDLQPPWCTASYYRFKRKYYIDKFRRPS